MRLLGVGTFVFIVLVICAVVSAWVRLFSFGMMLLLRRVVLLLLCRGYRFVIVGNVLLMVFRLNSRLMLFLLGRGWRVRWRSLVLLLLLLFVLVCLSRIFL